MISLPSRVLAALQSFVLLTHLLRLCLIHVTNKDFRQLWSQYQFTRNDTHDLSPLWHQAWQLETCMSATVQPVPYPPNGPSIIFVSLHFTVKNVVQNSYLSFTEPDETNSLYLPLANLKLYTGRFGSFTLRSSEYLNLFAVPYSLTLLNWLC